MSQPRSSYVLLNALGRVTSILRLAQPDDNRFGLNRATLLRGLSRRVLFIVRQLFLLRSLRSGTLGSPLAKLLGHQRVRGILAGVYDATGVRRRIDIVLVSVSRFGRVGSAFNRLMKSEILGSLDVLLQNRIQSRSVIYQCKNRRFYVILLSAPLSITLGQTRGVHHTIGCLALDCRSAPVRTLAMSLKITDFPSRKRSPRALIGCTSGTLC